jgi:hypothetical protein
VDNAHLVVEDLGLASLGLGDQRVIENIQDILADILKLLLDLITVLLDDTDVLVGSLGLLLLLDGGDDAPRGTAGTNNVLVGNGEQVALIDSELAANLESCQFCLCGRERMAESVELSYLGDFLFNWLARALR